MKNLFVVLMAVLVLAGCGAQKEEKKSASDVIMMAVEMLNSATEEIKKAETADDVVDVMASVVDEMKEIKSKYGDVLAELQDEKYADEVAAAEEAAIKFSEALKEKEQEIEMTPEAQEKMIQVIQAASEL